MQGFSTGDLFSLGLTRFHMVPAEAGIINRSFTAGLSPSSLRIGHSSSNSRLIWVSVGPRVHG